MDSSDKDATRDLDATDSDEDWHDQLLQLNTDVAMDFVRQNLEISNMESYCNAKEELVNDLKLQVTKLEGEVNLKQQELIYLQEKEQLLIDNLNNLNEMIDSKEETENILLENERLLKSKHERHEKEWKKITDNYNSCIEQMRENFEKNPLAQKRSNLQIEVQKQRINLAILKQQVVDQKEKNKMMREIRKRQEQTKIIRFAQVMVEYYEMQKMAEEINVYEKRFKEITENKPMQFAKKFVPKDDIFKVPQQNKTFQNKNNIKSSFNKLPPLNLSAYKINPQSFTTNKTINEGLKSKFSLNTSMDTMLSKLNMNKRSEIFAPQQKQKKLKTSYNLSNSLPLQQNTAPALRITESLTLPETFKIQNSQMKENRGKILKNVGNSQIRNDVTLSATTSDDLFEYTSQENVLPTQPLKSPYFPSASASGTASSQINLSGTSSGNENKTLEVSGEYNEHDVDNMETSSFVSVGFTSPPGPEPFADADADVEEQPNNVSFLNNMFGGASSSQTKTNNSSFSFLNTTSRKKSSQNIFSMF